MGPSYGLRSHTIDGIYLYCNTRGFSSDAKLCVDSTNRASHNKITITNMIFTKSNTYAFVEAGGATCCRLGGTIGHMFFCLLIEILYMSFVVVKCETQNGMSHGTTWKPYLLVPGTWYLVRTWYGTLILLAVASTRHSRSSEISARTVSFFSSSNFLWRLDRPRHFFLPAVVCD